MCGQKYKLCLSAAEASSLRALRRRREAGQRKHCTHRQWLNWNISSTARGSYDRPTTNLVWFRSDMLQLCAVRVKCQMEYCASAKVCTTLFILPFVTDEISDRFVFMPVNFELWTGMDKSDVQDHVYSKAMAWLWSKHSACWSFLWIDVEQQWSTGVAVRIWGPSGDNWICLFISVV